MCDERDITAGIRSRGGRSYVPTRKYLICVPQNNFHGVQADERVPLYYDIMFMCASDNNNDNMMMMMMIMTQFSRHPIARPKRIRVVIT